MDFPDKRLLMTNMDLTDTILLGQDKNSNMENSDDLNSNDAVDERIFVSSNGSGSDKRLDRESLKKLNYYFKYTILLLTSSVADFK